MKRKIIEAVDIEEATGTIGTHTIGESYGGGIVFWVDSSGQHGLVAATADQARETKWDAAIKVCADYRGGGYDDWYLPSKDELNLLYLQKDVVGGFGSYDYWSSAEYSSNSAWCQYFVLGFYDYNYKNNPLYVRAVRAVRAF